ncbi:MAG: family oxidoreductase [Verrucomicrobia bacterium]|nr:family oxidoreductase [Verrucomicrobiota bacterium]
MAGCETTPARCACFTRPMKLSKRVTLIVGGGNGLGRAAAIACAKEGAVVIVADLNLKAAQETLALAITDGARGAALELDIALPAAISATVRSVVEKFGRLDIMVNCAAICLVDALVDLTPERFDRVFAINTRGAFFLMQASAKAMMAQKFGRIITISTPASKLSVPLFATYGASKAGGRQPGEIRRDRMGAAWNHGEHDRSRAHDRRNGRCARSRPRARDGTKF